MVLQSGAQMPRVGFGTAGLGRDTKTAVLMALAAGYRHIDSAQSRLWYREVSHEPLGSNSLLCRSHSIGYVIVARSAKLL